MRYLGLCYTRSFRNSDSDPFKLIIVFTLVELLYLWDFVKAKPILNLWKSSFMKTIFDTYDQFELKKLIL